MTGFWPSENGSMPPDEPVCGFRGQVRSDLCPCSSSSPLSTLFPLSSSVLEYLLPFSPLQRCSYTIEIAVGATALALLFLLMLAWLLRRYWFRPISVLSIRIFELSAKVGP